MPEQENAKDISNQDSPAGTTAGPLVFISHDSRDAALAEAFGKLVKSVSAGMIKTFRSSDKKGGEGIDFGDEWYKRLMSKLQATSDVVCLFTERSLDRPWILFEAGVAKGKLGTPVIGIALGVPLSSVSTGPFYQFQNMDDSEEDLTKLVNQLARRVSSLELDTDVVKTQVQAFKKAEASILKTAAAGGKTTSGSSSAVEPAVAKLAEEIKSLPARVAERLSEEGGLLSGRRRRRPHSIMIRDLLNMSEESGDPVSILMAASLVRDDAPWLYELAMEAYRVVQLGDTDAIEDAMQRISRMADMMRNGPMMEFADRDTHVIAMEFPRMLELMLGRALERELESNKRHSRPNKPGSRSKPSSG